MLKKIGEALTVFGQLGCVGLLGVWFAVALDAAADSPSPLALAWLLAAMVGLGAMVVMVSMSGGPRP